uniref:PA domain-containing protein n=1 Tax=Bicosoecida sp. CB-2014 TaxID=1486930 RepID=A0A7S1C5X9_9STRA|mmetsp:Transcript_12990/g.45446  ORF Transcript_12990/g.45446 Transcript_12990/m.45446 type:complete len:357 (+) Transcript_12990:232-1302(+)
MGGDGRQRARRSAAPDVPLDRRRRRRAALRASAAGGAATRPSPAAAAAALLVAAGAAVLLVMTVSTLQVASAARIGGGVPPVSALGVDAEGRVGMRGEAPDPMTRRLLALEAKRREAYERWEREHVTKPQRERRRVCPSSSQGASGGHAHVSSSHTHRAHGHAVAGSENGTACHFEGVQVALVSGQGLAFCKGCPDPHGAGSILDVWEAAHGAGNGVGGNAGGGAAAPSFHVDAELVYAVPNDGSSAVLNTVGGTVVLMDRGEVAFVDKARAAQEAGADALLIADTGQCGDDFDCGGWLGSKSEGKGLAARDSPSAWEGIYIPVAMISRSSAERLRALMELVEFETPDMGPQRYVE